MTTLQLITDIGHGDGQDMREKPVWKLNVLKKNTNRHKNFEGVAAKRQIQFGNKLCLTIPKDLTIKTHLRPLYA